MKSTQIPHLDLPTQLPPRDLRPALARGDAVWGVIRLPSSGFIFCARVFQPFFFFSVVCRQGGVVDEDGSLGRRGKLRKGGW